MGGLIGTIGVGRRWREGVQMRLVGKVTLILGFAMALLPAPGWGEGPEPRLLTADDLKVLRWRSVGPANVGGMVAALALVPGRSRSFFVGYAAGGIFKTENLGVTFEPVFDKYSVISIGSIVVADAPIEWPGWADEPDVSPESRAERGRGKIVWVGTGEASGRNTSSWGGGVYRSTDGGRTFTHLGLSETHHIPAIAVDPRNPDACYVAALGHLWGANPERGVYKTVDGGKTWEHVFVIDEETGASDVVLDPTHPDTVYAGMYARRRTKWGFTGNSNKGGVYTSDDGGESWGVARVGLPPRTGRIGLAVSPKDPNIVYASIESDYGGTGRDPFDDHSPWGGVFRSENRGRHWARLSDINPRPFYFSKIVLDPEDDQRVYLLGRDLGISDDGGRTFRRSGSDLVHEGLHAMVVDPADPNTLYVGTDGGVYISHDRARTWDFLNNVASGQFHRIDVDMSDPYRIGGGMEGNGSWIGPSETLQVTLDSRKDGILNTDWQMVHGGDGFRLAFDHDDRNVVYATSQGGHLVRIHLDTGFRRLLRPSAGEGEARLRFNWNAPYVLSSHDSNVLYHAGNKVFKLTEKGRLWFAISGDLTRHEPGRTDAVGSDAETYGTVVSLAESPIKVGLLWAGTDDGLVHVTTTEGTPWIEVTPEAVGGHDVSRIVASAHDPLTAYVSVDGHRSDRFTPIVMMTRDLGKTWTEITGDLPEGEPVRVIIEDADNPDVLYCGTEFGVYVTLDRGGRWVRLNTGSLPPVRVEDMVLHPRERDLVVGTHGRSIYVLDDASVFSGLTPEAIDKPLAVLKGRPAKPRLQNGRQYGAGHGIFRARNPEMGAYINYWVREDPREPVEIGISVRSGLVIRRLAGPSSAGLNRVVWDLQADEKHRYSSVEEERFAQPEFVPAGEYKVTLTMGSEKAEGTIRVLPAPGDGAPPVRPSPE